MPAPEARTRFRRNSLSFDKETIANRIHAFYTDDIRNHDESRALRLQRYAKLRMWTEGKDWPWEDSSDFAPTDMMEASLRLQDTLHNSVMQQRPPIVASALHEADIEKEKAVNDLQDFQFFVEQNGENIIGELAQAFVDSGEAVAFIPWVKEMTPMSSVKSFDPIPDGAFPAEYFFQIVSNEYPDTSAEATNSGWDYTITDPDDATIPPKQVKFYTVKGSNRVEMVVFEEVEVYNGPRVLPKSFDQVLHPVRCTNLQRPGPSNPGGASHVILIDYPSIDEIRRLRKEGVYDLTKEEMDRIESQARTNLEDEAQEQKDTLAGAVDEPKSRDETRGHDTMTRLMVFDCYDSDGDGLEEDIVWWMILEGKIMLRAKRMSEIFPSSPPKRPLAEGVFLPVEGRRNGISLLELMETTHDARKVAYDQMADAGTISNTPFFFYRPTGNIKAEVLRLWPGEGYPLSDPQRDIHFPHIDNSQSMNFGLNTMALLQQDQERLVVQGDLQFGRIPAGKATALRTTSNLQSVLAQGEARPERILRRFFSLLVQIWEQMHERNTHFLPKNKQYRILGINKPSDDAYAAVKDPSAIQGRFDFTFEASVFNTSKEILQQTLAELIPLIVNPVMIQLGITKPDGIYRLVRDFIKSRGQGADKYISEPAPGAKGPFILAEEALTQILQGQRPIGLPAEGAVEHLTKLMVIAEELLNPLKDSAELTPMQGKLMREYIESIAEQAQAEQEQARLQQAAGQLQLGGPQDPGGAPVTTPPPDLGNPQVQPNELINEALPGA